MISEVGPGTQRKVCMHSVLRSILGVACACSAGLVAACGQGDSAAAVQGDSVQRLLRDLPNLADLDLRACSYVEKRSTRSGLIPSPADTAMQLKGIATLSPAGVDRARAAFEWREASRGDLPAVLRDLIPEEQGVVLVSSDFNAAFQSNARYPHGVVAVLNQQDWEDIYFVAQDIDHPVE